MNKCIFQLAHAMTKDTEMRELHAKFVHRVYLSNSYVTYFYKDEACTM